MGVKVDLSDGTFGRLQALAVPLIDSVEDVIVRLLDQSDSKTLSGVSRATPVAAEVTSSTARASGSLDGFRRELWEEVIMKLPKQFLLSEVYRHQEPLLRLHPENKAMDATIRAGLQRLRDAGYLEFVSRGNYRRLV
jgi:hypothetical protein